jgi:hypothetical protein
MCLDSALGICNSVSIGCAMYMHLALERALFTVIEAIPAMPMFHRRASAGRWLSESPQVLRIL